MIIKSSKETIDDLLSNSFIPAPQCEAAVAVVNEITKIGVDSIEYRNGNYIFKNKIAINENGTTFSISIRRITPENFVEFIQGLPEKYRNPVKCKLHNEDCYMKKAVITCKINSFICISGWLNLSCNMEIVPYIVQAFQLAKSKSQYSPSFSINDVKM